MVLIFVYGLVLCSDMLSLGMFVGNFVVEMDFMLFVDFVLM